MERRAEPRHVVTESDRSPIIQAIRCLVLATIFLNLSFRLLTGFFLLRRFCWDDVLIVISFVRISFQPNQITDFTEIFDKVFGVAQSITLLVPESSLWGELCKSLRQVLWIRGLSKDFVHLDALILMTEKPQLGAVMPANLFLS